MKNIGKHSIVKLLTQWECRPRAGQNLVAIELNQSEIYFNKPIYIGMCILGIAKTTIYDFYYNDNCSLLYTDTDYVIYNVMIVLDVIVNNIWILTIIQMLIFIESPKIIKKYEE